MGPGAVVDDVGQMRVQGEGEKSFGAARNLADAFVKTDYLGLEFSVGGLAGWRFAVETLSLHHSARVEVRRQSVESAAYGFGMGNCGYCGWSCGCGGLMGRR